MSKGRATPATALHDAAPLFAALGDETRLRLLGRLSAGGPGSIAQLSSKAAVSRQAITKHLRVLDGAGLVRGSRRGREQIWALEPKRLADAHAYLHQISEQWDAVLARLQQLVEE